MSTGEIRVVIQEVNGKLVAPIQDPVHDRFLEELRVRLSQLDEERRRICTALGLKASIYSDGRVEIAGHPAGGFA